MYVKTTHTTSSQQTLLQEAHMPNMLEIMTVCYIHVCTSVSDVQRATKDLCEEQSHRSITNTICNVHISEASNAKVTHTISDTHVPACVVLVKLARHVCEEGSHQRHTKTSCDTPAVHGSNTIKGNAVCD